MTMSTTYFDCLRIDRQAQQVQECTISDLVFSRATVDWGGHTKNEKYWMHKHFEEMFSHWGVAAETVAVYELRGDLAQNTKEVSYHLRWQDVQGQWHDAPSWSERTPAQQQEVLKICTQVLDTLYGLLLIE